MFLYWQPKKQKMQVYQILSSYRGISAFLQMLIRKQNVQGFILIFVIRGEKLVMQKEDLLTVIF